MTIQLELTKHELDILLRAMRPLVTDALTRTPCGPQSLAAEALENKLIAAFNASCTEAK